jgi:Domain of unknown function (DUF4268)
MFTEANANKERFLEFWTEFKERDLAGPSIFSGYRAGPRNYIKRDGGMTGIGYACSAGRDGGMIQAEFKYNSSSAKRERIQKLAAKLLEEKEIISEKLGPGYVWEAREHALTIKKSILGYGTIGNKEQWPTLMAKMLEEITYLRSIIEPHILKHLGSIAGLRILSQQEQQNRVPTVMVVDGDSDRTSLDSSESELEKQEQPVEPTNHSAELSDPNNQYANKEESRDSIFAYSE